MSRKLVVVTGAAGFIGGHLCHQLIQKGFKVLAVDKLSHFSSRTQRPWNENLYGEDQVTTIEREEFFDSIRGYLKHSTSPLVGIFHLGACTDTTQMDEVYLKRINLDYTINMWKLAKDLDVPLIYASSAATYGSGEFGYDDDPKMMKHLKPLNPYGQSKLDFDLFALEQKERGHQPKHWAGFKFFNVYGPGERHKNKMASVVLHGFDQISAHRELKLFKSHRDGVADGEQKRDFIYVEDVVSVLLFAWEHKIENGIYNLGTGEARSFLDLGKATFAALGVPENIVFIPMPESLRERYQYFTQANMNRIRQQGYQRPFTSLEEGTKKTVEWLRSHS